MIRERKPREPPKLYDEKKKTKGRRDTIFGSRKICQRKGKNYKKTQKNIKIPKKNSKNTIKTLPALKR